MDNNNKENGGFSYTYSAREQAELKRIREKYAEKEKREESKIEKLRRLDRGATEKAQVASLIFGVVGTLILGFGMSLIMTELSAILGAYRDMYMVIGVAVGLLGGILTSLAYPVYNAVLKRERAKIAPEIIRLTDELMK